MKKKKNLLSLDDNTIELGKRKLADFVYMNTWSKKRASQDFIKLLAGSMLQYFSDPKKIVIQEFMADVGISWHAFQLWCKDHELLNDVYQQVKMIIAARREDGMMKGRYQVKPCMYTQYQYSKDWDDADNRWSEMKKNERSLLAASFIPYLEELTTEDGKRVVHRFINDKKVEEDEE